MKHCVIGAGFSGLPIAKRLVDLGEDVEILDRNGGIGGLWHTGVYKDAHIISSKRTTELPDFPMPASYPDFPSKRQMQAYFADYARAFGLDARTRFDADVVRVAPGRDRGWEVTTRDGVTRTYATVALASGHHSVPRGTRHPGAFEGEIIDSSAYRDFHQLENKRVLVVGYGNTGCDIAVDAGRHGARAIISMRSGTYFFPKTFFGIPMADLSAGVPRVLQSNLTDRMLGRFVLAMAVGDLSRYGVARPSFRPFDKHPVINGDLLHAIRHGRVSVKGDVERFEGREVVFTDGTREVIDLVVYATGYVPSFPMLAPDLVRFEGGLPILFLGTLAPGRPGLYFAGLGQARTGGGPLFQASGYAIARLMAAEADGSVEQRIRGLWRIQAADRLRLQPLVARADMRSMGLAEARRKLGMLDKIADAIDAPRPKRELRVA
jgi:cation diffusion facilitator CzcD-associated flavoprotein CzcO